MWLSLGCWYLPCRVDDGGAPSGHDEHGGHLLGSGDDGGELGRSRSEHRLNIPVFVDQ